MNLVGTTSFFLLTICIASYGLTGAVYAQSQETPLSVETDLPAYAENSDITVSGKVRDSSLSKQPTPLILPIVNPDGTIVGIAQENLDSSNGYSASFKAAGPLWKSGGEYVVIAKYGAQKATTTFEYTGPSISQAAPEPEPTWI